MSRSQVYSDPATAMRHIELFLGIPHLNFKSLVRRTKLGTFALKVSGQRARDEGKHRGKPKKTGSECMCVKDGGTE